MAYIIKPSIGMLPIEDIDKAMAAKGFVKNISANELEKITREINPITEAVTTPGIKAPERIALSAGIRNKDGSMDRETVKNTINLNGRPASDYLAKEDKEIMSQAVKAVSSGHSNEIQLLRDELYQLKAELIKTGHMEDTSVANGFIDGFKHGNIKFNTAYTAIDEIDGTHVRQAENIFNANDWVVVKKDKANASSTVVASVLKESGNNIQLSSGVANLSIDNTVLSKSLGEYNKGTYSFSKMSTGTPSTKENYTMLNDDSNIQKYKIIENYTGYATVVKIPTRCAGFLTKLEVYGKAFGNPGSLVCHVIKGSQDYINKIAKTNGITQAKIDGTYIAKSAPLIANKNNEMIFDFTKLSYDPEVSNSSMYPEIEGSEYCFIVEADNVTSQDYWQIEFGHKKNTPSDLQTNNKSYEFRNRDIISSPEGAFIEMIDIDMLYSITTKAKLDEDEIPYGVGLYTTLNTIKLSESIKTSRARLTLEVNKEGAFISTNQGLIKAEVDTIEFSKADGSYAEQTVIGGGDYLIVGSTFAKVKTSTPNTVTVDRNLYLTQATPVYRCGYSVQLKTRLKEKDADGNPVIKPGSEKLHQLELAAVIPSGRSEVSKISDRLIFEVDMKKLFDANGDPYDFNEADLQIKWNSALSSDIIHSQSFKGNDYVGRIHNLSLAFDKII